MARAQLEDWTHAQTYNTNAAHLSTTYTKAGAKLTLDLPRGKVEIQLDHEETYQLRRDLDPTPRDTQTRRLRTPQDS